MAKLQKAEFDELNEDTTEDTEKVNSTRERSVIKRVYDWQENEGIYAWDEESLNSDLGFSIQGFTLAGSTRKGDPVEIEFFQPLDEEVEMEGVAHGYRLIQLKPGFYQLRKEVKKQVKDADGEDA